MNVTVLIGAGASYGSKGILPCNPPLGKDLYESLRSSCDQWRDLPENLQIYFQSGDYSFEAGMIEIEKFDGSVYLNKLIFEMGGFFSKFRPSDYCTYVKFFRKLKSYFNIINIISLNYEIVCDISAEMVFGRLPYETEFGACHKAKLIKPHGSCNFLPYMWANVTGCKLYDTTYMYGGDIEYCKDLKKIESYYQNDEMISPAMSMYAPGKRNYVGHDQIQKHREMAADAITKCDAILIIGTSYNPNDYHIWGPIINSSAPIFLCDKFPSTIINALSKEYSREALAISTDFQNDAAYIPLKVLNFFRGKSLKC